MTRQEKLKRILSYLKGNRIISTQKDLAIILDIDKTNLSSALNGNERYLTDNLFDKILEKFPEVAYIIETNNPSFAKNIISGNNHKINQGGVYNEDNIPTDLLEIIRKKDEQIAQKDEQINKLIELLGNK